MSYSFVHIILSSIAIFGILINQLSLSVIIKKISELTLYFPLYILTVILVYRYSGLDIDNYMAIYNDPSIIGWDFGWAFFNTISKDYLCLGFSEFLLFVFILEMLMMYKVSISIGVNFKHVLTIYCLHLAIVRDFAQLRIGFSIAICLYAIFCFKKYLRWFIIFISLSIHITSLIFIYIYLMHIIIENKLFKSITKILFYFIFMVGIISAGFYIDYFAIFDDRISIYINWDAEGFGAKVDSFVVLYFIGLLLSLSYLNYTIENNKFNRFSIISISTAFVIYISFSSFQIFSARLANVAISLYPFVFAKSLYYSNLKLCNFSDYIILKKNIIFLRLLMSIILFSILFRSGNSFIIDEISSKFFI